MTRHPVPILHKRRAARMDECLDYLAHLMSARASYDERGLYISGFRSTAMSHRASETPEPWTKPWWEAEGARLVFRALERDRAGVRHLAALWPVEDADIETEIVRLARAFVPEWCEQVAAMR